MGLRLGNSRRPHPISPEIMVYIWDSTKVGVEIILNYLLYEGVALTVVVQNLVSGFSMKGFGLINRTMGSTLDT